MDGIWDTGDDARQPPTVIDITHTMAAGSVESASTDDMKTDFASPSRIRPLSTLLLPWIIHQLCTAWASPGTDIPIVTSGVIGTHERLPYMCTGRIPHSENDAPARSRGSTGRHDCAFARLLRSARVHEPSRLGSTGPRRRRPG
ncbi:hypothetical protein RHA1_ro08988 (plasmid) [Rhodococcus jostii RHA1]|uniref:Uncharacterized protein n=1 Tax=Rhodococcus jostii (strain RHA1) TaxID=101510 RepID=Q0RXF4_RHOJR|nr:hypothetical protein RHA1_ro08988 [Rhodococcus jostii RHA1]